MGVSAVAVRSEGAVLISRNCGHLCGSPWILPVVFLFNCVFVIWIMGYAMRCDAIISIRFVA